MVSLKGKLNSDMRENAGKRRGALAQLLAITANPLNNIVKAGKTIEADLFEIFAQKIGDGAIGRRNSKRLQKVLKLK